MENQDPRFAKQIEVNRKESQDNLDSCGKSTFSKKGPSDQKDSVA